jgi:hypothetical protein
MGNLGLPYISAFAEMHFMNLSPRASATWLAGLIPLSSLKSTVRVSVILSIYVVPTVSVVALVKLDHAVASIYMYVQAHIMHHDMDVN